MPQLCLPSAADASSSQPTASAGQLFSRYRALTVPELSEKTPGLQPALPSPRGEAHRPAGGLIFLRADSQSSHAHTQIKLQIKKVCVME